MLINIIVAFSKNMGIGLNNSLPWNIPSDLKKFRDITIGHGNNAVIMGKNTWNSLPLSYLKKRDNLILSSTLNIDKSFVDVKTNKSYTVKSFCNIDNIIQYCINKNYDNIWIIGGNKVYNDFLNYYNDIVDEIYITYIDSEFKCDTFFTEIDNNKFRIIIKKLHDTGRNDTGRNDTGRNDAGRNDAGRNDAEIIENNFKIYDIVYKNIYLSK